MIFERSLNIDTSIDTLSIPIFFDTYFAPLHKSTHHMPAKVIFDHELRLQYDSEFEIPPEKPTPINEFIMEMRNRLRRTYKIIRNQLHLALNHMKTCFDVCANSPDFSAGHHVWSHNPACKKGCWLKLQQEWNQPYVIVKSLDDVVYRILKPGDRFKVVYMDCLAPWKGDHNSASWIGQGRPTLRRESCYA